MNIRTRVGAFAAAVVLTLTVAACGTDVASNSGAAGSTGSTAAGSSTAGSSASDTAHNDADVMFAQQMTIHHRGAVAMADLAPDRAENAAVKTLAEKIKAAQAPEIEQMTGWLQAWGKAGMPPSSGMADMSGMNHASTGNDGSGAMMPGMMTDQQMQQLTDSTGAGFDKMFLEMMIVHHQGALQMSKTEKQSGQNTEALALADTITSSQTAEIAEMKALLQGK